MPKKLFQLVSIVLLLIGLGACSTKQNETDKRENAKKSTDARKTRLAVIGDSISDGVNTDLGGQKFGWVEMLTGEELPAALADTSVPKDVPRLGDNFKIKNFSISGSTAADWDSKSRLNEVRTWQPDSIIVYLGGNDVLRSVQDGKMQEKEITALSNHCFSILKRLKSTGANLYVINYYDLFDTYSAALKDVSNLAHLRAMSGITRKGNELLSGLADTFDAVYIDLYSVFLGHCYGRFLGGEAGAKEPPFVQTPLTRFDIHPDTDGHRAIAARVKIAVMQRAQQK